jgi:hypothetical protein
MKTLSVAITMLCNTLGNLRAYASDREAGQHGPCTITKTLATRPTFPPAVATQ